MYNGRQRHIQTESIQDQSVKKKPVHGHRDEESAFRHDKFPAMKNKNTWQREKCTRSCRAPAQQTEQIKSMQCYIWFHSCKLDFIHVTIAYAIR